MKLQRNLLDLIIMNDSEIYHVTRLVSLISCLMTIQVQTMRSTAVIEKYKWKRLRYKQQTTTRLIPKLFVVNSALSLDPLVIKARSVARRMWSIEIRREENLDFSLTIDLLCQSLQCRSHRLEIWSQSRKMLTHVINLSAVNISSSYCLSAIFVWIPRVLLKPIS